MPPSPRTFGLTVLVGCAFAASCGGTPTAPTAATQVAADPPLATATAPASPAPTPTAPPPPVETGSVVVNVIGDTGWCGSPGVGQVAKLLARLGGDVLLAGDLAYPHGTLDDYRRCFDPEFGRLGRRLRPSPGNHEYDRAGADGYFTYFGDRAGPGRLGYYAFRAATWQVLMLNSAQPIGRGSAQYQWVADQLQLDPTRCTLATLHHPFDSSGPNGPTPYLRDVWGLLHEAGADVVVSGHDHLYERFAPQDASVRPDPVRGIRQFTAGTGGAPIYARARHAANSEVVIRSWGVLRLNLQPSSYEWEFLDVQGTALDGGFAACH